MDRLLAIACFVRVARLGSFSAAARALERPQSQVSRLVAQLESQMGVALLERSTRRVRITDAGRGYLEHAQRALDELEEGAAGLRTGKLRVQGKVRLASGSTLARLVVMDTLAALLDEHPQLAVELWVDDRTLDPLAGAIDLSLCLGPLPHTGVVARRLGSLARGVVAAPRYLRSGGRARPAPAQPQDLTRHVGLWHAAWPEPTLRFGPAADEQVVLPARLALASDTLLLDAALRGLGVAVLPLALCRAALDAGDLVQLLPGHALEPLEAHATYAPSRRQVARVEVVLEALLRRFPLATG